MTETPTPLDLDAIRARIGDQALVPRALVDELLAEADQMREKIDVDRAMHEAFRPEVVAEVAVLVCDETDWQAVADWCGGTIGSAQEPSGEYTSRIAIPGVGEAYQGMWIVQRHDLTFAIRATLEGPSAESVARLTARPAPAWDEEVVVESVATALHGDGCPEDPDEGESCACSDYLREARIAVAVVREHLPVKPGREDMVEAMLGSDIITDDLRADASAQGSTQREPFLCFADAVLDLLDAPAPAPSVVSDAAGLGDRIAALPLLTAAPSATRDEVARTWIEAAPESGPGAWERASERARERSLPRADALLARFTITPKEDR